jgi:hypothetical protein
MTPPRLLKALCAAVLLGIGAGAQASTTITITIAANQSGYETQYAAYGYTHLSTYTVAFTIPSGIAANSNSNTYGNGLGQNYRSESAADGTFFSSIGGSALLGAYSVPADTNRYENFGVSLNGGKPYFVIKVQNTAEGPTGLKMLNNTDLTGIDFFVNGSGFAFNYGEEYIDPALYFATYMTSPSNLISTGPFNDGPWGDNGIRFDLLFGSEDSLSFGVNSFAITSAVPEPSTYAALLGLAALGLVALRRRARA